MTDSDEMRVPDAPKEEFVLAAAGGFASLIPGVGGLVAAGIAYAGQQRMNERLNAYADALGRKFVAFQVQIDNLSESTWSTAFHAAQAAARTHQQEKLDALLNATLNSALPGAPDDDLQHIFVTLVDELTPMHLRLLAVRLHPEQFDADVEDYRGLQGYRAEKPDWVWNLFLSQVSSRRDLIDLCFKDLVTRGLLGYEPQEARLQRVVVPSPTAFAWEFLDFITEPKS